jgi:hypothetical protein
VRVLASSLVVPTDQCIPATFTSLQVNQPARNQYTSGTVQLQDNDGNALPSIPTQNLDATGSVKLSSFNLVTQLGLPQFLITLAGAPAGLKQLVVTLTWTGAYSPSCVAPGTTVTGLQPPPPPPPPPPPNGLGNGTMWLGADGGMFAFGNRPFVGAANLQHAADFTGPGPLTTPDGVVIPSVFTGVAATPDRRGYLDVLATGQVFHFGDAPAAGDLSSTTLNASIVGVASDATGKGYWLVGADGGVFAFGDAGFSGGLGATALNAPIVGIASDATGKGYWLAASDGGVFAFGDALFFGSLGSTPLNAPIVGIAATKDGRGYDLVAADGGVFAFGDGSFHGSLGGMALAAPITAIALSTDSRGYWLVGGDGGAFAFGDAPYEGNLIGIQPPLRGPIIGAVS